MTTFQRAVLFYSLLVVIIAVNLILAFGLWQSFVANKSVSHIEWLLGTFAAELVGSFVLGWRVALRDAKRVEARSGAAVVVEKADYPEDDADPSVRKKEVGRNFLIRARDQSLAASARKQLAQQALEIFLAIPADAPAFLAAQYDSATALRILGAYEEALKTLGSVHAALEQNSRQFSERELDRRRADIEMMVGNVYQESGQYDLARDAYFRAWKREPGNLIRALNLRDLALTCGNSAEAQLWDDAARAQHEEYEQLRDVLRPLLPPASASK